MAGDGYLVRSAHRRAPGAVRPGGGGPPPRPAPQGTPAQREGGHWETALFETYRDQRVPLEIVCFDGIVIQGYLRAWERYTFLVDTPQGQILLMKHGVIRMGPRFAASRPSPGREGAVRVAPAPRGGPGEELG
jgi:sRNA-binding regulator protein Hfq